MAGELEPGTPPPAPETPPPVGAPPAAPPGLRPATYRDVITAEAKKNRIPPDLAFAMVNQESAGSMDATSVKGARGFYQLMPDTAAEMGLDPNDPIQNIQGGLRYMRQQLDAHGGDVRLALAAYNAGPGAVKRAGGVPNYPETNTYIDKILAKLKPAEQRPAQPVAAAARQPGEEGPPQPGQPPPKPPPETWAAWATRHGKEMLSQFDPGTPEGRRNLAGGVGAAIGTVVGAPTALVAGPAGPATTGVLGAMTAGALVSGGEKLIQHFTGGPELNQPLLPWGQAPSPQPVGTPPPSMGQVAGAALAGGAEQGVYEMGGRVMMWPFQVAGRHLVASRVGKYAQEGLSRSKQATLDTLTRGLEAAQQAFEQAKGAVQTTREAAQATKAATARQTRQEVSRVAGEAKQRVAQATTAAEQKAAGAAAPYERIVGAPPPSAAEAGRQANRVIFEGGAAEARDIAGRAVDEAAATGPDVDITKLKAEAQRILETQIRPPETTFPRRTPEMVSDEAITAQSGIAPDELARMRAAEPGSKAAQNLADLQAAVASAQGEAEKETLKHPAFGILSRILNAEDTVPFRDAHLWKKELDNAIRSSRDQAQRSQVQSLTQHLTGMLRTQLKEAGHAPYEAATANYAKIVKLHVKGMVPKLKKLIDADPEAAVRLLNPKNPTGARMMVDLLTTQAAAGGEEAEGRQALEALQSAWVHQRVISGGIEKLGERLDKIPAEFREAFLSDPKAKQVLDNLKLIHTAYQTAVQEGERGIAAARTAGQQAVERQRTLGENIRAQTASQEQQKILAAQRQALQTKGGIPPAREALAAGKAQTAAEEEAFRKSSLGEAGQRGQGTRKLTDLLRVAGGLSRGSLTGSYWTTVSLVRLLHGPTARDLIQYAAYSPAGTQALVSAITSNVPALALADLARSSGVLGPTTNRLTGQKKPPTPRGGIQPPGVGTPPPRPYSAGGITVTGLSTR